MRHAVLSLALLALFPLPSEGGISAARATKQLDERTEVLFKTFRSDVKAARAAFFDSVTAFETTVQGGGYAPSQVTNLYLSLSEHQAVVQVALADLNGGLITAIWGLLNLYSDSVDLEGQYPKGFTAGDRSVLDRLHRDVARQLDKECRKLTKRLGETAKILKKQAGVAFTFFVRPPGGLPAIAVNQGVTNYFGQQYLRIDSAFGVSSLAQTGDGLLSFGGPGDSSYGDVSVLIALGGLVLTEAETPSVTDRWSHTSDNGGLGLPEGNYLLGARQNSNVTRESAIIGIR